MSFLNNFKSKPKIDVPLPSNEGDAMETFFHIGTEKEKAYYIARERYKSWLVDLENYTKRKVEKFYREEEEKLSYTKKEANIQEPVDNQTIFGLTSIILKNNGNKAMNINEITEQLLKSGKKINSKKPHDSVRATLVKYVSKGLIQSENGMYWLP